MYLLLACVSQTHTPQLLALAALLCLTGCYVAVGLIQRFAVIPQFRAFWLLSAAFTTGVAIWTTHFVAMLAYDPGMLVSYDPTWTGASLLAGAGFALPAVAAAQARHLGTAIAAAGIGFGLAISATHNLGMLGVIIPGTFVWNMPAVVVSDLLAGLISAAASASLRMGAPLWRPIRATALMFVAIFVLHFVGIGTAVAIPDPGIAQPAWTIPRWVLACVISAMVLSVLALASAALWIDARLRAADADLERMRDLTDAALEGIAILQDDALVAVNRSLADTLGREATALRGSTAEGIFGKENANLIRHASDQVFETLLHHSAGTTVPANVQVRWLSYRDGRRCIVAVRDLRERARAEARIRFLVQHDPLTGLSNRGALALRLDAGCAEPTARPFALLCIDLDRFKDVNDTFGHAVGDALLILVAERLRSLCPEPEAIFRQGGDEFVVLLPEVIDAREAEAFAEHLIADVARPYLVNEQRLEIGASVGISAYPRDGAAPSDLLQRADVALYRAKSDGKGRAVMFEPSLEREARERRVLRDALGQAVENGEFSLVYQAQVPTRGGSPVGYEALLRWDSPQLGRIPPTRFIPAAEESGLILQIGAWVLREACRTAVRWTVEASVTVNVSAMQLRDTGLTDLVRSVLHESGLEPARLELELTESALIRDQAQARVVLRELKALGVTLALDDFGTGHASLSYLQHFPFDTLKIDRAFVGAIENSEPGRHIVRAIIQLGHGLNLRVVAEGVENYGQLIMLQQFGCDFVQGFLFGEPSTTPVCESVNLLRSA